MKRGRCSIGPVVLLRPWVPLLRLALLAAVLGALATVGSVPVRAEVLDKTRKIGGTTVHTGGAAAKRAARKTCRRAGVRRQPAEHEHGGEHHRAEFPRRAKKRGYIVVAPAAPNDELFFRGGERGIFRISEGDSAEYKIQDGKFHIRQGVNGSVSHSRGLALGELFSVHHRVSRIFAGGESGQHPGHFQNVHSDVRGGSGSDGLAEPDEEEAADFRSAGVSAAVHRGKGAAAPAGDAGGPECGPAVRSFRTGAAWMRQVR